MRASASRGAAAASSTVFFAMATTYSTPAASSSSKRAGVAKPPSRRTRTRARGKAAHTLGISSTAATQRLARFVGFPDDFTELVDKRQRRLVDKHGRHSIEGRGLRALREIRVRAVPAWDSTDVEVFLWFVRDEDDTLFEGTGWSELLSQWLRLVPPGGRFQVVEGQVVTLDDMTARDYVDSDPLDLDYLSTGARP